MVEFDAGRRITWEPMMVGASRPGFEEGVGHRLGHRWGWELTPDGADATMVTEFFDCGPAPAWLVEASDGGNRWRGVMTASLERLDELCGGGASPEADAAG